MPGRTARQATSAVSRLAESISDQSGGFESAKSDILNVPATLTSTSTGPYTSLTSATKAEKCSKSAASHGRPHTGEPPPRSSLIIASRGSAAISVSATCAPCAATSRLTALPMVPPAPVTSTTRSFSRNVAPFSMVTWASYPAHFTRVGLDGQAKWPSHLVAQAAGRVSPHVLQAGAGRRRVGFLTLTSCSGKTRLDSRRWAAIARRAPAASPLLMARSTFVWAAIPRDTASGALWLSNIPFTIRVARGAKRAGSSGFRVARATAT